MISVTRLNRINEIQKEIRDKYSVIKEIDFSKEIDIDKSDRFAINSEYGYLRFLYKDVKEVRPDEYSLVNGRMLAKDDSIELLPTLNDMTDNKYKRAHIIMSKGFKLNQVDNIQLDIKLEYKSCLQIMINNKYSQQLFERQKRKEIFLGSIDYDTPKRKLFSYQLGADLIVRKYEGLEEKLKIAVPFKHRENVNLELNLREGCAVIGEQKRLIPQVDFDLNEELYVSLFFVSEIESPNDKKVLVNSLKLHRNNGFIYFKPLELRNSNLKVFMLYKGASSVQKYSNKDNEWSVVHNEQQLCINNLNQLRIKMADGDQLFKLMLVK